MIPVKVRNRFRLQQQRQEKHSLIDLDMWREAYCGGHKQLTNS
jgi:hypothetical protein